MDITRIQNNQGKRYFGIHFYPGVAQYQDSPQAEPYRVFLNEDTLRRMDKSFEGRPIFVDHVEAVTSNINDLRSEADGWVVKSFYNENDGKHWVEFIITSELGQKAIDQGMRLSNAYVPKSFKTGGLWNGVPYEREIVEAEYEHLAIVENPRYEESVIMTPERFTAYNENHAIELKRIANSKDKDKGAFKMKLNFFKRSKVETALDPETMVVLPKSQREVSIMKLVNEADEAVEKAKEKKKKENADEVVSETTEEKLADMARPDHQITTHDGQVLSISELVKAYAEVSAELEALKKEKTAEEAGDESPTADDDSVDNSAEEEEEKKKKNEEDKEKEAEAAKKKKNAAEKARRFANAEEDYIRSIQNAQDVKSIELPSDRLARGKSRYGSGR